MCDGNCNQGRQCTCEGEDQETAQGVMLAAAVWTVVALILWLTVL